MTFTVFLFATLKDKIGKAEIELDLDEPLTVKELMAHIFSQFPQLAPFENRILVAVNQKYASPAQFVSHADEIALFPPVSGG